LLDGGLNVSSTVELNRHFWAMMWQRFEALGRDAGIEIRNSSGLSPVSLLANP